MPRTSERSVTTLEPWKGRTRPTVGHRQSHGVENAELPSTWKEDSTSQTPHRRALAQRGCTSAPSPRSDATPVCGARPLFSRCSVGGAIATRWQVGGARSALRGAWTGSSVKGARAAGMRLVKAQCFPVGLVGRCWPVAPRSEEEVAVQERVRRRGGRCGEDLDVWGVLLPALPSSPPPRLAWAGLRRGHLLKDPRRRGKAGGTGRPVRSLLLGCPIRPPGQSTECVSS